MGILQFIDYFAFLVGFNGAEGKYMITDIVYAGVRSLFVDIFTITRMMFLNQNLCDLPTEWKEACLVACKVIHMSREGFKGVLL